jgi:hypothetical protein
VSNGAIQFDSELDYTVKFKSGIYTTYYGHFIETDDGFLYFYQTHKDDVLENWFHSIMVGSVTLADVEEIKEADLYDNPRCNGNILRRDPSEL